MKSILPRTKIYLIGETGGITTNEERAAQAAETMGFRRVTHAEYAQFMQKIRAQEHNRIAGLTPPAQAPRHE